MNLIQIQAIRSPIGFAGSGCSFLRLERLVGEFGPLLANQKLYVRLQGCEHFITTDPGDSLYFDSLSPRSGDVRYDWKDRGDGVYYGY